jgi:hypothetical protein
LHSGRATVKGVLIGPVGAGSVVASEPAEREGALLEVFECQTLLYSSILESLDTCDAIFGYVSGCFYRWRGYFVQRETGIRCRKRMLGKLRNNTRYVECDR